VLGLVLAGTGRAADGPAGRTAAVADTTAYVTAATPVTVSVKVSWPLGQPERRLAA